jgi:hypothetical protein
MKISAQTVHRGNNVVTNDAWLADRRAKLTEPEFIKIRLLDFELVSMQGNKATVRFTLVYERPGYADETFKELVLNNDGGGWLIEDESNLGVKVLKKKRQEARDKRQAR